MSIENALEPLVDRVLDLKAVTDGMVQLRWGTVAQGSPLRVRLDGDEDPMSLTPATVVPALTSGERVMCAIQHNRVTVLAVAGRITMTVPEIVVFESSGTFAKADYPGLRAVRVRLVGGGAQGGDSYACGSGEHSGAGGGGGGGYAERVILAEDLAETETVTVGAGGVDISGYTGGPGGTSSFGTLVSATGGLGGTGSTAHTAMTCGPGGQGGTGTAGDILHTGVPGAKGTGNATLGQGGDGGPSQLGGGGRGAYGGGGSSSYAGNPGGLYGGGGGGGSSNTNASSAKGGVGAPGVVIVEVYQ